MVDPTSEKRLKTAKERLDLKSLERQRNAEELGPPCPERISIRLSLVAL
jgi:hypothetical protein